MARPPVKLLSPDLIVKTALRIIDADGVAGLSMRKLAAQLGVSGPSLYHHFASKDEILDAIVDTINSQIRLEDPEAGWEAALTSYAYQLRAVLVEHPHVVEFLALRPVTKHGGLRIYEHMIGVLSSCGWEIAFGREVVLAVENLVYGAALMANAPDIHLAVGQRAQYPLLSQLPSAPPRDLSVDGFDLGFAALIEGVRRLIRQSDRKVSQRRRAPAH
jgi:AcrR family transcriptional regulator